MNAVTVYQFGKLVDRYVGGIILFGSTKTEANGLFSIHLLQPQHEHPCWLKVAISKSPESDNK